MESFGYLFTAMAGASLGTALGGWLAGSKVAEAQARILHLELALEQQARSTDQLMRTLHTVMSVRGACATEDCKLATLWAGG